MLKLKVQYFGHVMQRANSLEKTLMLGKTEGQEEKGMKEKEMIGWHHWFNGPEFEQTPGEGEKQGKPGMLQSMGLQSRTGPVTQHHHQEQRITPILYVCVLVTWSRLTLYDPVDCSPPGSFAHGIFQARILEWLAIPFSRGSSQPKDRTGVSYIEGRFFTIWATRTAYSHFTNWRNRHKGSEKLALGPGVAWVCHTGPWAPDWGSLPWTSSLCCTSSSSPGATQTLHFLL